MHVLLVGPLHSGLLYVDAAHGLGAKVSVITTDAGEFVVPDDVKHKIDTFIKVPSFSLADLAEAAAKLHQKLPIDAVAAGVEFFVVETAHLAKELGVAGLDPAHVERVRNKAKMRARLQEAGVKTVRFAKAGTAVDLEHVAKSVGFPAVVKPLSMAGSVGVVRVDNDIELLAAYEDIANDQEGWGGIVPGSEVLVEQFLVGTEYCVDGYVTQNGEVHVFEFVKVELGQPPHFQEIGYTAYRREDLPVAGELETYLISVVKALDITIGPFHSEVMLTDEGPVLIEIANRLPGDHLPLLSQRATGISFAACALASLLNVPIPEPEAPLTRVAASQFVIDPSVAGEAYEGLEYWDELTNRPQVQAATLEIPIGSVVPLQQDFRSRIAEIRYDADSIEEAEAFRKEITEKIRVIRASA
jgi:biotin carboxylase